MKKTIFLAIALVLLLAMAIPVGAGPLKGNGIDLNGPHYNLNIIGVPKGKTADMTGDNGHRIFVPETGGSKIMLQVGEDFQVLDANGTDGTARFALPVPAACDPSATTCVVHYTVWIRALGKPEGKATMYTCAVDAIGDTYCSDPTWYVTLTRNKGKSSFTNVSRELLFLSIGTKHYPLFNSAFSTYYWQYNNTGLKLAQLRFYMGDYTVTW